MDDLCLQTFKSILNVLRKLGFAHSQVSPHIYYLIDMLNINRTGLHAGTASSTIPEHFIRDYSRNHVFPGFDRLAQQRHRINFIKVFLQV
jgi:hypothetical protein